MVVQNTYSTPYVVEIIAYRYKKNQKATDRHLYTDPGVFKEGDTTSGNKTALYSNDLNEPYVRENNQFSEMSLKIGAAHVRRHMDSIAEVSPYGSYSVPPILHTAVFSLRVKRTPRALRVCSIPRSS
jgi:hypothetical protein